MFARTCLDAGPKLGEYPNLSSVAAASFSSFSSIAESAASRDVFVVVVSGRSEGGAVAVGGFLGFTAEVGVELLELQGGQKAAVKGARGSY